MFRILLVCLIFENYIYIGKSYRKTWKMGKCSSLIGCTFFEPLGFSNYFRAAEVWDIKDTRNEFEFSHSFIWLESRTNCFPEDPLAFIVPDNYCIG